MPVGYECSSACVVHISGNSGELAGAREGSEGRNEVGHNSLAANRLHPLRDPNSSVDLHLSMSLKCWTQTSDSVAFQDFEERQTVSLVRWAFVVQAHRCSISKHK